MYGGVGPVLQPFSAESFPEDGLALRFWSFLRQVQNLSGAKGFKITDDAFCGGEDQKAYDDVLMDSVFGIVPKGSEHYSHRLTEVIAAGAVPVIINDDFLAPYALGDVDKWAVRVPEFTVGLMPAKLESMSNASICEMKRRGAGLMHF
ncbi:unnamed protein product, partial [Prorocentrum cordatum]